MSWVKKLWAACLSLNLVFCFRLRALSPSLPTSPPLLCVLSPSLRHLPPSKAFPPVILVLSCKYPKCVSFYILYFCRHWEVLSRLCEACNKWKNDNTDHKRTARRGDVKPKRFHPALSVSVLLIRVFVSDCIMLKKNDNNNKLLSHLINCILKELVVYKRLDYSRSTTTFWS